MAHEQGEHPDLLPCVLGRHPGGAAMRHAHVKHTWSIDYTPGVVIWECERCHERHMLTVISAANPERLRSMLVVLEAPCVM